MLLSPASATSAARCSRLLKLCQSTVRSRAVGSSPPRNVEVAAAQQRSPHRSPAVAWWCGARLLRDKNVVGREGKDAQGSALLHVSGHELGYVTARYCTLLYATVYHCASLNAGMLFPPVRHGCPATLHCSTLQLQYRCRCARYLPRPSRATHASPFTLRITAGGLRGRPGLWLVWVKVDLHVARVSFVPVVSFPAPKRCRSQPDPRAKDDLGIELDRSVL